jgi:hypothetical protein
MLRCTVGGRAAAGLGQFLPPSLVNAMEELASTPDSEAHNLYASF